MSDHPKTKIYNYIAKNLGNPFTAQIRIIDVEYEHHHQLADNANIFTCIVKYILDNKECEVRSEECLSKKDSEKQAFDIVFNALQKTIRYKASVKQNRFSVKDLESNILFLNKEKSSSKESAKSSKSSKSRKIRRRSRSRETKKIKTDKDVEIKDWIAYANDEQDESNIGNDAADVVDADDEKKSVSSSASSTASAASLPILTPISGSNGRKNRTEWKDDISKTDMSNQIIVIVDYENISKQSEISKLNTYLETNSIVSKVIKVAGFCSNVKITADIIVRSNRSDAVDHYISYLTGKLESCEYPPKKIYVISRDKFGSCL